MKILFFLSSILLASSCFSQGHTTTGSGGRIATDDEQSIECKKLKQDYFIYEQKFYERNELSADIKFKDFIEELYLKVSAQSIIHPIDLESTITKCPCRGELLLEVMYIQIQSAKQLSCQGKFLKERIELLPKIKIILNGKSK